MEIFINELSLKGQFGDLNELETAITRFNEIFSVAKGMNQILSNQFLLNYKAIRESLLNQVINRIDRDESLKFKRIVFNQAISWQDEEHRKHSEDDIFFCDALNDIVTDTTIAEAAERQLIGDSTIKRLIVNFIQSDFQTSIHIIKNDKQGIEIDCIETKEEFEKWLDFPNISDLFGISANRINDLIKRKLTHIFFKRVDTPKIIGEQMHIHLHDEDASALNIDGSWKHGGCDIPTEAKQILIGWGFKITG